MLIDSHCHLDLAPLVDDLAGVIDRAKQVGIGRFVVPAVSAAHWQPLLALAEQYEEIYVALGLHPYFQNQHKENHLTELDELLSQGHPKLVAVGECGLDWVIEDADKPKQLALLKAQLELANRHALPVVLHVRKAHPELLALLKTHSPHYGAMVHGFSGSEQLAWDYVRQGCMLGVGGTITYARAAKTRQAIAAIPLEHLLLETDSPDMPLHGFQGQANEPARLPLIAEVLAELKQVAVETVTADTADNAYRLFGFAEAE
ncbi:TatD family hydrolase [Corallincola platygyrae]|uniref:TatD family hydrolase n=1 Tax=Corallincola platygyrae TaxID=1193278 RepID=A0ABW4XSP4_9GAMM